MLQCADRIAVLRQSDRRLENLRPFEAAITTQRVMVGCERTRDGCGAIAAADFARPVGKHLRYRAVGRPGGAVQREGAFRFRQMDEHHDLPAESGRGGFAHAERQRRGDRGIDSVAALFEHADAGARGAVMGGRDHALAGNGDPLRFQRAGVGRRRPARAPAAHCGAGLSAGSGLPVHRAGAYRGLLRNAASSSALWTRLTRWTASLEVPRSRQTGPMPHRQATLAGTSPATDGQAEDWCPTGS